MKSSNLTIQQPQVAEDEEEKSGCDTSWPFPTPPPPHSLVGILFSDSEVSSISDQTVDLS